MRAARGGMGKSGSVAVPVPVTATAVTVEVGVAIACIGKGSVGSTVEENRWDGRSAPTCKAVARFGDPTTSARAFQAGWARATSVSGGGGSSSIANVGAVGAGDEAVAQGVTDDIVIAVLVGPEYHELKGRAC